MEKSRIFRLGKLLAIGLTLLVTCFLIVLSGILASRGIAAQLQEDIVGFLPVVRKGASMVSPTITPTPTESGTPGVTQTPSATITTTPKPTLTADYVLLGWNDLGMHCYNLDFSDLAVLPPYNTIWAQLIRRGDPPAIVTNAVKIEYSFADNMYSAGKTNFWDYAQLLFGLTTPLPPNIGLAGKGLTGDLDSAGNHFIAVGIPLTEFNDSSPTTPDYFQMAHLVAKDTQNGKVIATTDFVAPVSSEMRCDKCHNQPNTDFLLNILSKHDEEENTNLVNERPVLCANCHADPALGATGQAGIPSLSLAMHSKHAEEAGDGGVDLNDCYACHPGPNTKCLRDVMSQDPTNPLWCTDCHGNLQDMANPNRVPWTSLPSCGNSSCHGSQFAENPGVLYRFSTGHGGLYCESCHNSTHAILPSREAKDNQQVILLQGYAGPLKECTICHLTTPDSGGPHTH